MRAFVCMWVLGLLGCGLTAPARGRPLDGEVASATFEVRQQQTDVLEVDLYFPATADGTARPSAVRGGLVLVQGGLVGVERYGWLAHRLAAQGFVVALPHHDLNLAITASQSARTALELLRNSPHGSAIDGLVLNRRVAVGGHSLGGVVASTASLEGGFDALVLLASYPIAGEAPKVTTPTLALTGALDCRAKLATVEEGLAAIPAPLVLGVLDGVTHFQFTDSHAEDLREGCSPMIGLETAHDRIATAVQRGLEAMLVRRDGSTAGVVDAVDGIDVVRR